MPGRQAHGRALTSKKPKARKDNKKRSQNAFAIALQENEEIVKVRRNRLGESEGDDRPRKRARDGDNVDEDEDEETMPQRKKEKKGRFDQLDIEEGSDSEGNEWMMGEAGDDDSDLDSDEAFGESDEEKFDGYAFSGSSKSKPKNKSSKRKALDLDEDSLEDDVEGPDDESLGEDAIDLATMLDQTAESDEEETKQTSDDGDSSEEDESDDEGSSSDTSADDDSDQNPEKLAALQNLMANLPQQALGKKRQRGDAASEYNTPSDFGVTSKTKLTLEDLGLSSVKDPNIKKSLKMIDSDGKTKSAALAVPLARRQQDRLDRAAAYEKSKETLDKWTDTVKSNRRADHLVFPLPDADVTSMNANSRLQATTSAKPFNDLEAAIQSIMEESGLAATNGKDDEDKIREYEELQTNKMSMEEVKARRDQLRMARELMFREEAKAKRIKKIKSKSYRKVHRKERERDEEKSRQSLLEAGIEPSEDEQEAQDRRRATERMGDKHRGSKWAKATKAIGRAAWDEDARAGITEMARRDEELRKRVEGRNTRRDENELSESSQDESDDDSGDEFKTERLLSRLDKLKQSSTQDGPGSKLANMKFMLKADATRKQKNDEMVEDLRKTLAGEDSQAEEESDLDVGRRQFGPTAISKPTATKAIRAEFEEPDNSDEEVEFKIVGGASSDLPAMRQPRESGVLSGKKDGAFKAKQGSFTPATTDDDHEGGAWSRAVSKKKDASSMSSEKRRKQQAKATDADELDVTNAAVVARQAKPTKKLKSEVTFMQDHDPDDDSSDQESGSRLPFAIRDQELIKRAFAGADVVGDFEAEKRQVADDEDEKIVDSTLPGWGSWTGDGLSKKEKKMNKGRFMTKSEGIKQAHRKDAKLEKVIINQKRVKKNSKYLASTLPHPFETRQQYERSLRLPVGPEWTTKETFQDATKPRILLKQGIIAPMSKPLL